MSNEKTAARIQKALDIAAKAKAALKVAKRELAQLERERAKEIEAAQNDAYKLCEDEETEEEGSEVLEEIDELAECDVCISEAIEWIDGSIEALDSEVVEPLRKGAKDVAAIVAAELAEDQAAA